MKKHHHGFTLLEVTVAIALIVIAFGGLMGILIVSQDAKVNTKYDLIAENLAKEGLELVRFKRDQNYNNSLPAFTGIYDPSGTPYPFTIDSSLTITPVATTTTVKTSSLLKIFNSQYGYSSDPNATTSVFRRLITTTYNPGATPEYIKVQVEVAWQSDNKQKIVTLEDELTDWR